MKKLLTLALSLAMGATCVAGLAACTVGTSNTDKETANKAILTLEGLYAGKTTTDTPYSVYAEVAVDGISYAVDWSISSDYAGYENYVSLGDLDETKSPKEQWISITQTDEVVEYKLNASVTVGKETASTSMKKKISAAAKVYSCAEVVAWGMENLEHNTYSMDRFAIKGYVVDTGSYSSQYNNWTNVYIADSVDATKDNGGFQVYRLATDNVYLTKESDLEKGDLVTLYGYLQRWYDNIELTYKNSDTPVCIALQKGSRTPAEKIADALSSVPATINVTAAGAVTLPASTVGDVTFTWSTTNTKYTISSGKLNVSTLPQEDETFTITVTAACNGVSDTKNVTVTIKASVTIPQDAKTVTTNVGEYAQANGWSNGVVADTMNMNAIIKVEVGCEKVNAQYGRNSGKFYDNGKNWRVYQNEDPSITITAVEGCTIATVKFTYTNANTGILTNADKTKNYASDERIAVNASTVTFTVGNTNASTTNGNIQITAIEVSYTGTPTSGDIHDHEWVYSYNGDWTHNLVQCNGNGTCDYEGKTENVPCNPNESVCACGHTFTADEIFAKFDSLKDGEYLNGTYKLTGTVTSTPNKSNRNDTDYSFYMMVGTTSVQAYYVSLNGHDIPAKDDVVTVSGPLMRYQPTGDRDPYYEFDGGKILELNPNAPQPDPDVTTVAAVKAEIETELAALKKYFTEANEYVEFTTSKSGTTITWAVTSGDSSLVSIDNQTGKLTILSLPTGTNAQLTITVTITLNDASDATLTYTFTIESAQGDSRNDEEKVADALDAVTLSKTTFTAAEEEIDLPDEQDGLELAWEVVDHTDLVEVTQDGKLHIKALPTSDTVVTLKVTATSNSYSDDKEITITVKADPAFKYGTEDAPISIVAALALAAEECVGSNSFTKQIVYAKGIALTTPTKNTTFYNEFDLGDIDNPATKIIVYTITVNEGLEAPAQNDEVVIYGYIKNHNGTTIEFASNSNTSPSTYVYLFSNKRGESTITLENDGGATVTGIQSGDKKTNGTTVTFQVAPASGKKIVSVKAGSEILTETSGNYTFTMKGNMTVTVESADENAKVAEKIAEMVFNKTADYSEYVSAYTKSFTATSGNYSWTVTGINNNDKAENAWDHIRAGRKNVASNGTIDTASAMKAIITKMEIVISATGTGAQNVKVYIATDAEFSDAELVGTKAIAKDTLSFNIPADKQGANLYYRFEIECDGSNTSANGYVHIDSVAYYGFEDDTTDPGPGGDEFECECPDCDNDNCECTDCDDCTCEGCNPGPELDEDEQKVADALKGINLSKTTFTEAEDEIDLPTAPSGVTFKWEVVDHTDLVEVTQDGKLHIKALPATDTVVTLKVTATSNDYSNNKDITITVKADTAAKYGSDSAPLSVTAALALAKEECATSGNFSAQVVYAKGIALSTPTYNSNSGGYYNQFELGDVDNPATKIVVYSITVKSGLEAPAQNDEIVLYGYLTNYNGTYEFASNSGTYVYLFSNKRGESTITLGAHDGATVTELPEKATNGTTVEFKVEANSGKEIVSVKAGSETLTAQNGKYSFTMLGNMAVTVETKDVGAKTAELLYGMTSADQPKNGSNSAYNGNCDLTVKDITWNINGNAQISPWRFGGNSISNTERTLSAKTAISGKVTKVSLILTDGGSITVNSVTLKVYNSDPTVSGASAVYTKTNTSYTKDAEMTFTPEAGENWSNCYFQIVFNLTTSGSGNKYVTVTSLEFYGFEEGTTDPTPGNEDKAKVDGALNKIDLSQTTFTEVGEESELPKEQDGLTLKWEVQDNTDLVEITADGKLKIKKLPDVDTVVTLKVSATSNEYSNNKDIQITVKTKNVSATPTQMALLSFASGSQYTLSKKVQSYTDSYTATAGGLTWDIANFNNQNTGTTWYSIRTGHKTNDMATDESKAGKITTQAAMSADITKIVVKLESALSAADQAKVKVRLDVSASNTFATTVASITKAGTDFIDTELTFDVTPHGNDYFYRLVFLCEAGSGNGYVQVQSVEYIGFAEGSSPAPQPEEKFDVTFEYRDEATQNTVVEEIKSGETVGDAMPANPTREGYNFDGWFYMDESTEKAFTKDTPVTADMTVYAKWTKKTYTVTIKYNDEKTPDGKVENVEHGNALGQEKMPADPAAREGYRFDGWYYMNGSVETEFEKTTPITANLEVYAKWTAVYTVTFTYGDYDGAPADVKVEDLEMGAQVGAEKMPADPSTREYFTFDGWYYMNGETETEFLQDTSIEGNTNVYAKWSFSVTVGATDNSLGYPGVDRLDWKGTIKQGEMVTLSGEHGSKGTENYFSILSYIYSGEKPKAVFRADAYIVDQAAQETAENWTITNLAGPVGWANFKSVLNGTVKISFDWRDANAIYITIVFTKSNQSSTMIYKIVSTKTFATSYNIALGAESAHAVLTSYEVTTEKAAHDGHNYVNGLCAVCGQVQKDGFTDAGFTADTYSLAAPQSGAVYNLYEIKNSTLTKGHKLIVIGTQTGDVTNNWNSLLWELSEGWTGRSDSFGWSFNKDNFTNLVTGQTTKPDDYNEDVSGPFEPEDIYTSWADGAEYSFAINIMIRNADGLVVAADNWDMFKAIAKDCTWRLELDWAEDGNLVATLSMTANSGSYAGYTFSYNAHLAIANAGLSALNLHFGGDMLKTLTVNAHKLV